MSNCFSRFLLLAYALLIAGCANISTPTGGKRDSTPPKLISITPADSLRNTKVKKIELRFDEYITVGDAVSEVHLSPILQVAPTVSGLNKHVTVKIVDSLLEENTTYRLSFGNAIKDLNEGNVFTGYTYTFSTGSYFDSMQLQGRVINANTGLPDSGGVTIMLYSAKETDSAIVQKKPKYVTKSEANGAFTFKGLPRRTFKIYALKDANNNLVYDGPPDRIAFSDKPVTPGDTTTEKIMLKMFEEAADSSTANKEKPAMGGKESRMGRRNREADDNLTYGVSIDTSNKEKRTFDITRPINISFNKPPELNKDKITLTYTSEGTEINVPVTIREDTAPSYVLHINNSSWLLNTIYTLRLAKGFAKDTAGTDVMPSKYTFRTYDEEDYGKITLHVPARYSGAPYLLRAEADGDSVYQQPVRDTMIVLAHLRPGKYTFRIIADKNGNGKWDTGDLFGRLQPEDTHAGSGPVTLKAGWDNTIDFELPPTQSRKPAMGGKPK